MGNPKKLWKTLNLGLPEKRLPCTDLCLKAKEEFQSDPFTISELFKILYSNLANDLIQKVPAAARKLDIEAVKNYNINKAARIDDISGRLLKDGADVLAIPITQICNLSIKLSHFPKDCKLARLKLLHKKDTKTDPKNFRLISLLPIVSKIIEKVIHNQTMEYLMDNNILYKYQSGFCKNHSTDTSPSYLADIILITSVYDTYCLGH